MKIKKIEVFQVRWSPNDKPAQNSAWVRIWADDGRFGIGEASPMQGGLASLGMIKHDVAPLLIGRDPLDHAVLLDQAVHTLVKLGPEGALTGALAALDIAAKFSFPVRVVHTQEFANENYTSNPANRCYFCKHELFEELTPLARAAVAVGRAGLEPATNGL